MNLRSEAPTFDWSLYTGNLKWLPDRTLFLTRHGSHSYGTNLPTSDMDIRGIAVAPIHYYLGLSETFEQTVLNEPVDLTIFDVRKFCKLAADANPNALEILFTDPSDHLYVHPLMGKLFEARTAFISQKAKHTFSGYARSQLKRINAHYRWLKAPLLVPPTRSEFGLPERTVIPADQLAAAQAAIDKQIDQWEWHDLEDVDPALRQSIQDEFTRRLLAITKWSWDEVEAKVWDAAAKEIGLDTNFIRLLDLERQYTGRLREWQNYQTWKTNRNEARAALEAKFGYDCYLSDTEFLTSGGWKRYDEVTAEDLLATLNQQSGQIEFQSYTDRVSKLYTGKMAVLDPRHSNCAVTLNHRMWTSPARRSAANGFSWGYAPEAAEWTIQPLQTLLEGSRSYFHVRLAGEPRDKAFEIGDDFLTLMGAYVSEGCVGKRLSDGTASVLRISQKVGGRMCPWMDDLQARYPDKINRYEIVHEDRAVPCHEHIWTIADRTWARKLEGVCGSSSIDKRLPGWTRNLTLNQAEKLLNVMCDGDGTPHGNGWVYYTASRRLADDIQAMCVCVGIVSAVWGPYPNGENQPMFHVFIGQKVPRYNTVVLREDGSHSCEISEVRDVRIVCFTVPNETLVTRRNGKIAIHGNTKHAMHLIRLTRMCREILTDGVIKVKRPDASELLEIRNGSWTYEQLLEFSDRQDAELNEMLKTSLLPKRPDLKRLDQVCLELILQMG